MPRIDTDDGPRTDWAALRWHHAPPAWAARGEVLHATTGPHTDFWRETHYGFVRDSGHFLHAELAGDFTLEARVGGDYGMLYDQAGVMLRVDERVWLKAGVEFTDGLAHLSVVVTHGRSDWSVRPLNGATDVWWRVTRSGDAVLVQYSLDGTAYRLLRLAPWPVDVAVAAGVMCCSPERDGEGFEARFDRFSLVRGAVGRLHED